MFCPTMGNFRAIECVYMSSDDHREYIKKIVDSAPPLTPEQRARLRELLRPVAVDPPNGAQRPTQDCRVATRTSI